MKLSEFKIGQDFMCNGNKWRCTDIGTRVITAFKKDRGEESDWYDGPPYGLLEMVFDEEDLPNCEAI